jgi:hypothetical protein
VTCTRCHAELTPLLLRPADELCTYCATLTRIEAERGLAHLEAYLAKWAAFERWLDARLASV